MSKNKLVTVRGGTRKRNQRSDEVEVKCYLCEQHFFVRGKKKNIICPYCISKYVKLKNKMQWVTAVPLLFVKRK